MAYFFRMNTTAKFDEIVLAAYLWNRNGRGYLFEIMDRPHRKPSPASLYYKLRPTSARLRLGMLVKRGWVEPAGTERGAVTRGSERQLYSLTPRGQNELLAYLRSDRFTNADVLSTRGVFHTCLAYLWDVLDDDDLRQLVNLRLATLDDYLGQPSRGDPPTAPPDIIAVSVARITIEHEASLLRMLLESIKETKTARKKQGQRRTSTQGAQVGPLLQNQRRWTPNT